MDVSTIKGMLSASAGMLVIFLYIGAFDSFITPIMKVYIFRILTIVLYFVIFNFAYKGLGDKVPFFRENPMLGFIICLPLSIIFGFLSVAPIAESILGQ